MILDDYFEQKTFRTSYRQGVTVEKEQALITFHEAGFFRDLQWIKINHDLVNENQSMDGSSIIMLWI